MGYRGRPRLRQAIAIVEEPGIQVRWHVSRKIMKAHRTTLAVIAHSTKCLPQMRGMSKALCPRGRPDRGHAGTEGALEAMQSGEVFANKTYREAQILAFTPHIGELVWRNYQTSRSTEYLEEVLAASHEK